MRKRIVDDTEKFHVKIMNSVLKNLWMDHQVVIRCEGRFQLENEIQGSHLKNLKAAILHALSISDFHADTESTGSTREAFDKLGIDAT